MEIRQSNYRAEANAESGDGGELRQVRRMMRGCHPY